ncbi:hypothetical protein AVEN_133925-1 [Araneus ventricosus]|uniref:Uncharacterized protein n=1 Tax=Araneus ventricosus TaxID=182803 RepID=A0A4Y2D5E2_ARAVE|nr:hypothetical protein AVEN_133925-1 [Araneus ventricosus]
MTERHHGKKMAPVAPPTIEGRRQLIVTATMPNSPCNTRDDRKGLFYKEDLLQTKIQNGITKYKLLDIFLHIPHRHLYICRTMKSISRNHPDKKRSERLKEILRNINASFMSMLESNVNVGKRESPTRALDFRGFVLGR